MQTSKNLRTASIITIINPLFLCFSSPPGTYDRSGSPLIYIEVEKVLTSGLNCYEIATVLLYYNTLPIQSPSQYCIHLLLSDSSQLAFIETLDSALQLLSGHLAFGSIYVSGTYDPADNKHPPKELIRNLNVHIKYLNNETVKNFIGTDNLPIRCCGFYVHDQREWIDFFRTLEPLQGQCIETGRRLVTVLNDIRNLEVQGTPPTRRQLHSQHRALSRALMDSELQNLRRKGPNTIQRLQDKLTVINNKQTLKQTKNLVRNSSSSLVDSSSSGKLATATGNGTQDTKDLINARLSEVITIFQEVDRAARKLEQLTEQRRERLREMTRQRALDDEINEVNWAGLGAGTLARCLSSRSNCRLRRVNFYRHTDERQTRKLNVSHSSDGTKHFTSLEYC